MRNFLIHAFGIRVQRGSLIGFNRELFFYLNILLWGLDAGMLHVFKHLLIVLGHHTRYVIEVGDGFPSGFLEGVAFPFDLVIDAL